jgi:hypothetical protein
MCRAIALRVPPWLGRTQIQVYFSIIGLQWLYLNLRFELMFTAIRMGSDDNWSDVVMCPEPVKSACYFRIDLALWLCA